MLPDPEHIQTNLIGEPYFLKKMSDAILRTQVCTSQRVRDCCNEAIDPDLHFASSCQQTAFLSFSSPYLKQIL
jgi:hypothetical protein